MLARCTTGNGNDQNERAVEVTRFLPPPLHCPLPQNGSLFVRSFVRSFVVVDARLRAEREMERELPGRPTDQPVCALIDQHCCRIRLQRDGHIDWQSVSPGHNEACPSVRETVC